MRISNLNTEAARQGATRTVEDRTRGESSARPTARPTDGDRVEISAAARLAAQGAPAQEGLSPERIASLRSWLDRGGHRDEAVLDQVARRIADLGDLQSVAGE